MFACLAVHWMWLLGWIKTKWPSKPDDCTFGFVLCEPQICSHCPHITLTFRSGLCGLEPHWKPKHFSSPIINTHSCVAAADLLLEVLSVRMSALSTLILCPWYSERGKCECVDILDGCYSHHCLAVITWAAVKGCCYQVWFCVRDVSGSSPSST